MVGAEEGFVDFGGLEIFFEGLTDEEVVDAPADVVFAGVAPVAPPGVTLFFGMQEAEGVEEAGVDEVRNSLSFFVGEAGGVVVGFRAGEVDFFVGGVKIATDDDRFNLFEVF